MLLKEDYLLSQGAGLPASEQPRQCARASRPRRIPVCLLAYLQTNSTYIRPASLHLLLALLSRDLGMEACKGIGSQKVPIEKHVAPPPMMTKSRSSVSTALEPTSKGRGIPASGRSSRLVASMLEPEVWNTTISSWRRKSPSQPTPPRRMIFDSSCTQDAPNLNRSRTVSSPRTSASLNVMVGFCAGMSMLPRDCRPRLGNNGHGPAERSRQQRASP